MFQFGEKVKGYNYLVINEREARASAGILFLFAFLSIVNSIMIRHNEFTTVFIAFFTFDFLIKSIQPRYSPSLLLGRIFVKHLKPEYVNASGKRVAWVFGFILSLPMFYFLVLTWQPDIYKILVCIFCLGLLFLESAFSFCLGCWFYEHVLRIQPEGCPGGACELQFKDDVQKFDTAQFIIASLTVIFISIGSYLYMYKLDNQTYFGEGLSAFTKTKAQILELQDAEFQKLVDREFNDEFEDEDDE